MKDSISGNPGELKNLVDYQDGSVVSRELVRSGNGSVTLFAFDEGQALSEHTAPYDALVYVVDGQAKITIDGKVNILKAGDVIMMPCNRPHALEAVKKFKMLLVMIRSKNEGDKR